jgi:hypothetical protein
VRGRMLRAEVDDHPARAEIALEFLLDHQPGTAAFVGHGIYLGKVIRSPRPVSG